MRFSFVFQFSLRNREKEHIVKKKKLRVRQEVKRRQ